MRRIVRVVDKSTGTELALTTPTLPLPRRAKRSKMEQRPASIRSQRLMGRVVRRALQRGTGIEGILHGTARMLLMELSKRLR